MGLDVVVIKEKLGHKTLELALRDMDEPKAHRFAILRAVAERSANDAS